MQIDSVNEESNLAISDGETRKTVVAQPSVLRI